MKTEFGGLECSSIKDLKTTCVFLVKDEAAEGRRGGQYSQVTQAVITVLQVLVALVAA